MDDYILLDILLGLIVALFAAIGYWRGAVKEVVVTAGIFAGAALASSWAVPWGSDLADLVDMRVEVARLLVAATALLTASLVLGYGGSALVRSSDVGLAGRLLGAALALINGCLLLHYCLWFVERFLTDEGAQDALDHSDVSRVLLRQFGWLLIGAAGLVALAIAAGLLLERRRSARLLVPVAGTADAVPLTYGHPNHRQRPPRLPRGADGGKYEPVARGYDPVGERYTADAAAVGQTIPLPPVDAAYPTQGGGSVAPSADSYTGEEWYRRAPSSARSDSAADSVDQTGQNGRHPSAHQPQPGSAHGVDHRASSLPESGANGHTPLADASAYSWVQRSAHPGWGSASPPLSADGAPNGRVRACHDCGAELDAGDGFCQRCGAPVG
ncbi:MAG TPA: CvpA family protein [Thermomicrobiales bacterium]|nr:CvpA family protein [Thermomicrobiales bacterium]